MNIIIYNLKEELNKYRIEKYKEKELNDIEKEMNYVDNRKKYEDNSLKIKNEEIQVHLKGKLKKN